MDKQSQVPPPPRAHAPDVPPDLDNLCVDLLQFDPRARPSGRQVLKRLGATDVPVATGLASSDTEQASLFVGRDREIAVLHEALARTEQGEMAGVLVTGQSGVGKSMLLQRFVHSVTQQCEGTVVLAGRCYEREIVPYNGFDGVVDALARYLRQLPGRRAEAFVPRFAAVLARVFPVLGRVEAIERAPLSVAVTHDPQRLRSQMFDALRELLFRIAERHRVIVVVDDLQWADAASMTLLSEIMRPPDAPPVLLLASARTPSNAPASFTHIDLDALDTAAARHLAHRLLVHTGLAGHVDADAIAAEAAGHPLYIVELVRHAQLGTPAVRARPRLDDAIRARVAALAPGPRSLLELVVIAGAPLARSIVRDAAGLPAPEFARALALLRVARLVRGGGVHGNELIETYHDRVREAVDVTLADEPRRRCHRQLAHAIEAGGMRCHPEQLLRHFEGAGDTARAASYAERAACQAGEALAFERAAQLYRDALRLHEGSAADVRALRVALADVLACAGRGGEAARLYGEAAEGADALLRLHCKRRVTECLLKTGDLTHGLDAMHDMFGELGVALPRSPRATLAAVMWTRARLRLRGYRWRQRDAGEIRPRDLVLADMLHGVARGLALVDFVRSAYLGTRALLLALELGDRRRVLTELAFEAMAQLSMGGRDLVRGKRLLASIRDDLEGSGDSYLRGLGLAGEAIADFYEGRFAPSLDTFARARDMVSRDGREISWETNVAHMFEVFALRRTGQLAQLSELAQRQLHEAELRADMFSSWSIECNASVRWLIDDRPAEARAALDGSGWRGDGSRMDLQRWWELLARVELTLYEGDDRSPARTFHDAFERLDRSLLARALLPVAVDSAFARGRLCVAGRSPRLRSARRWIRRLDRCPYGYTRAWARGLSAACALRSGDRSESLRRLRAAIDEAARAGMALEAAAYRARLGALIGGAEGERLRGQAAAYWAEHGVVAPARMIRMVAPGLDASPR